MKFNKEFIIKITSRLISCYPPPAWQRILGIAYSNRINRIFRIKNCWFEKPIGEINNPQNIKIGKNCFFGKFSILSVWNTQEDSCAQSRIKIGDGCHFGDYIHITSINGIVIGNNVLTGRFVTISDNSHGMSCPNDLNTPPTKRVLYSKGSVVIGDNVWIGDKATILPNVNIGTGAIVGANSVVTKDIPPYCVAVGNPARIVKTVISSEQ